MREETKEMVKKVRAHLKSAQDWKKNFADRKRSFRAFQVGDHVYIQVRAKKRNLQWTRCAKLAPQFCRPFQILARIGPVAYQLVLPSHIHVHNVFHIYLLKKYIYDPKHVINWQDIQEGEFLVKPMVIKYWREVTLLKQVITQVKVQWQHYGLEEATLKMSRL
eukprot:PITA_29181